MFVTLSCFVPEVGEAVEAALAAEPVAVLAVVAAAPGAVLVDSSGQDY